MSDAPDIAALVERHHDALRRFALVLAGGDRQEALDVVQECYLAVLERPGGLGRAEHPAAYLFGIVRHLASRRRRRGFVGRLFARRAAEHDARPGPIDPETLAARGEEERRLRVGLDRLPPRQREVVALVFGAGLTIEEAARALGLGIGTARTHYHRAKVALGATMEDHHEAR